MAEGSNADHPMQDSHFEPQESNYNNVNESLPEHDLSRITYVAAPKNEPAGINMEDFIMQDATAQNDNNQDIDKKRLGEIINEVG